MTPAPQLLSNEVEDFQAGGGLYPGGTGIAEEVSYRLWDYNGTKPKDSFCSAYIRFRPIDGSNEGKVVEQYYSIGSSSDFVPDQTGGHLISLKGKVPTDSTNWAFFLKTLRNNCGLEKGRLSGPIGIRAMERGVLTLVQVDQPHREGLDELPATQTQQQDGKKKYKPKTLIPTRATFQWDPNYTNATRNVPAPAHTQTPPQYQPPQPPAPQYQPPVPQTQAQAPIAPTPGMTQPMTQPMSNGTSDHSLAGVIRALLTKNGGSLSVSQLPALVLQELAPPIDRMVRVNVSKESKDPAMLAAAAQANGWTLSEDDLIG